MSVAVAPRVIFRRNTPRAPGSARQLGQRLSVDLLAGHVDIDAFYRHRQQLAVVNFLGRGTDQVHQHVAPAGHGHDVPSLDHGIGGRIDDLFATSDTLDEHPLLGKQRLGFLHRLAHDPSSLPDAERAQLELVPGCAGTAQLLLAAVLLLVALARGLEIDAEQGRAEQGKNNRGPDRAEDVGDGIGDRHRVQELLGLFGRQTEAVDRIGRQAHRRRDRLRTCIEPGGGADVIAGYPGADIGGAQTEQADHRGKQRLRNTVLRDAAYELRSHPVADREQEHQEKGRLERP